MPADVEHTTDPWLFGLTERIDVVDVRYDDESHHGPKYVLAPSPGG
jgi:hypothetical protein